MLFNSRSRNCNLVKLVRWDTSCKVASLQIPISLPRSALLYCCEDGTQEPCSFRPNICTENVKCMQLLCCHLFQVTCQVLGSHIHDPSACQRCILIIRFRFRFRSRVYFPPSQIHCPTDSNAQTQSSRRTVEPRVCIAVVLSWCWVRATLSGPSLVFTLTLQGALENMAALHPWVGVLAYADDMFLQGPPCTVAMAFAHLCSASETIGLRVQHHKCMVFSTDCSPPLPQTPG
jgi:hypothetical protein